MNYEKIILSLLDRIVTLEKRIEALENTNESPKENNAIKLSKKYRLLTDYLSATNYKSIKLYLSEIENILHFKLPKSARKNRSFWANTKTHSIALSWLCINYKIAEVNLNAEYVVFEKVRPYMNEHI